ncbi:MAG: hypothetical protein K2G13_05115 [Muribaculaceae bacterium]|nr:hypothetical protein [Muribaculaceae bacterium]
MEISRKFIDFVRDHSIDDVVSLRLKYSGKQEENFDFDLDFALLQIEARRKSRKKIPGFLRHQDFLFPTLLAAEQASNEAIARFHASLIPSQSTLLDLTAGLGIDDMCFAMNSINVTACEIDEIKCDVLRHNAKVLGVTDRLSVINRDSISYIHKCISGYDVVFADPARRDNSGSRVHALSDCQPDILSVLTEIMTLSPRLLVKCSPLLDLSFIRNTVDNLCRIYVVCFKGECKEVLIDIQKNVSFSGVTVVDIDHEKEISRFNTHFASTSKQSSVSYCDRKNASDYRYLYEPNTGVMKTGEWYSLVETFPQLSKSAPNSHIFLSDALYKDFPGRIMKIISQPDKRALKAFKGERVNVVSRNHPLSAPEIIKKYSLSSGNDRFLYAFRYNSIPIFLEVMHLKV